MAANKNKESDTSLKRIAAVLGGSTALLLGVLYALGAGVEARRLAIAHVSIADVLPQVPLPYLLADGIGLLVESLLVIAATTLVVIGLLQLETRLEPYLEGRRRRIRTIRSRMAMTRGEIKMLQDESKKRAETVQRVRDLNANPPQFETPVSAAERKVLLSRKAELEQLVEDARDHNLQLADFQARVKAAGRQNDRFARQVRMGNIPFKVFARSLVWGPIGLALIGGLFVTPPLAASFVTAGLVWRLRPHTGIRVLLMTLYIIVVIGFVANRIIYVTPLPKAQVNTGTSSFQGTLVLTTDAAWYLAGNRKTVLAIPSSRVTTVTYTSGPTAGGKTVADLIEGAL
jgi:hypothetical protein